MKNVKAKSLTLGAMISALYIVLTIVSNSLGLSSGQFQIRLSEALCVLPVFTASAIPGLAIGCFLANLLIGAPVPDLIFGSLATLIAAYLTYRTRNKHFLPLVFPVVANAAVIPLVLYYAYGVGPIFLSVLTVAAGEIISAGILGHLLRLALEKADFRSHLS